LHKWHDPDIAAALLELLSLRLLSILVLTLVLLLLLSLPLPFPPKLEGITNYKSPQEWLCVVCNVEASFALMLPSLSLLLMLEVKTSAKQVSEGTQFVMDLIKLIVPIVTSPKDC
jgi:hypothetical protein